MPPAKAFKSPISSINRGTSWNNQLKLARLHYNLRDSVTMPDRILRLSSLFSIALLLGLQHNAFALPEQQKNLTVNASGSVIADAPEIDFKSRIASPWSNAQHTHTLEAHKEEITLLRFSPDGKLLASVEPSAIALWEVETGELLRTLPGHYSTQANMAIAPTTIAFSPDGRYLATATWSQGILRPQKSILVWDTATGAEVMGLEADGCRQILFSHDGDRLFGACGKGIQVWDLATGEYLYSFDTKYPLEAIALSADGKMMATANANTDKQPETTSHQIQVWELEEDQATLLTTFPGHNNDIAQLAFIANGHRLVSSSYDGKIKVWNWEQGKEYPRLALYSKQGLFSLDGNSRFIAGNFPSSLIANLVTGLPLKTSIPLAYKQKTSTLALSTQGRVLAWAGKIANFPNPVILLWQPETSEPLASSIDTQARDNYQSLALDRYWGQKADSVSPVGKNPQQVALAALGLQEKVESEQEEIEVDYPQDRQAVVTITQTQLADDSIAAIRYRVEFAPYGDDTEQQWQVVWAGRQWQCQPGRGDRHWSTELCD